MNKEQNLPKGPELSIIGVALHQTGLTINMVNSYEQRIRTRIMLDNIRQSDELKFNKEIQQLLTHDDVAVSDVKLNK
ncbi:MAG: hypothetical protein IPN87_06805 [Saprospiraceae bacterium]|nr:hypothetical protein [Candidatus Brachybacter algidus]